MIDFGWKKDLRDERDYLHPTVGLAALLDKIILDGKLPDLRNQGSMGSCVGHGLGANLSGIAKQLGFYTEWYSPQWIWNWARFVEGTLSQNVGVYPRDALECLAKNGCLLESSWKYSPDILDTSEPADHAQNSIKYSDFQYFRCVDGVDGICSALAEGHLVSIGSPWFSAWSALSPAGTLSYVTKESPTIGGHMYLIYGYDKLAQGGGQFYCMNSWGPEWGDKGFFKMYFGAVPTFKELWGYDAYYLTFTNNQEANLMITFKGSVSGQDHSGEPVSIYLSKPDGSTENLLCATDDLGGFSKTYDAKPGLHKAQASIGSDSKYKATSSQEVQFEVAVSLLDRTITLQVDR